MLRNDARKSGALEDLDVSLLLEVAGCARKLAGCSVDSVANRSEPVLLCSVASFSGEGAIFVLQALQPIQIVSS